VANIGVRPTFGGSPGDRCVEAHIIDYDAHGDPSAGSGQALYGREVTLDVVGRLREERRFPDAEALAAQIQRDIKQAREMLSGE
jgi:riboflavin kinase/FMN adenylyltransferase